MQSMSASLLARLGLPIRRVFGRVTSELICDSLQLMSSVAAIA